MLELRRPSVRLGRIRPSVDPAVPSALVALNQTRFYGETVPGLHQTWEVIPYAPVDYMSVITRAGVLRQLAYYDVRSKEQYESVRRSHACATRR
jgi:hypothetical protein